MKRLLILALAAALLAGCSFDFKPWEPSANYGSCLEGHNESRTYMTAGGMGGYMGGVPMGGGMHLVTATDYVCDRYEYPNGDSPAYRAKYAQYRIDLAEWRTRNPEAD
ncbi:lipoprotein [Xanthomonas cannabis]|uniref:lipoprotein n=1 Tax=Xanthomonas cannabis TaxID=1885674 RepID=UPI0033AB7D42